MVEDVPADAELNELELRAPAVLRALELKRAREEQDRAEQARRQSEERYRMLVEGVRDVILALSPDGIIISLNPAFEAVLELPRTEWIGKPFDQLVHPEDLPLAVELFSRVARGEPRPANPFRVRTRKGDYRLVEVAATAHPREGQPRRILGSGRDATRVAQLQRKVSPAPHT